MGPLVAAIPAEAGGEGLTQREDEEYQGMIVEAKLEGRLVRALVDTGAAVSLMSMEVWQELATCGCRLRRWR